MSTEPRFYIKKPSGSQFATVVDRTTGAMMKRFNIFKTTNGIDGWTAADRYCGRLNQCDRMNSALPPQEKSE
jgi:hypothetical protein